MGSPVVHMNVRRDAAGGQEEDTPLQVNLDKMGKWIAYGALSLCAVLVVLGIARGNDILEMIIWGLVWQWPLFLKLCRQW